jgi:hypothetical protein
VVRFRAAGNLGDEHSVVRLAAGSVFNPTLAGGFENANFGVWVTSEMLFNMKMMTIFSMLLARACW